MKYTHFIAVSAIIASLLVAIGFTAVPSQAKYFLSNFDPQTQPNANDDQSTTLSGVLVHLLVLGNDIGSNLSITLEQPAAHGTTTVIANSSIDYKPNSIYVGTDTIRYRITDMTDGLYDIATVVINVMPNPSTVTNAVPDFYTVQPDTPTFFYALNNDMGSGITISSITTLPAHGTASIVANGTAILYTPDEAYQGADQLSYRITSALGNTDIAAITIDVTTNVPPTPNALIRYCTPPFTPVTICDTWSDPNGDPIHIDVEASGTTFHCSLNLLSDSCIRYTPLPGFLGADTVRIVVCDDHVPTACSTTNVVVYVGNCPAPQGNNDIVLIDDNIVTTNGTTIGNAFSFNDAVLPVGTNDIDFCTDNPTVSYMVQNPAHGTAYIVNGAVHYDAATNYSGSDILSYAVCNSCGLCDTAIVSLQIMPANGSNNGGGGIVCDNPSITICKPPFSQTAICPTFCKFPTNAFTNISTTTSGGTLTATANNCFNFVPPATFEGTYNLRFVACGGNVCDTTFAVVTIDPNCGTNYPNAANDNVSVVAGGTILISPLSNDIEPDGQNLTLTSIITQPACGSANISGNQIAYNATANCSGIQTLSYIVCDATALCDTATVSIDVEGQTVACDNPTEYCTPVFTPVTICLNFCELNAQYDDVAIADAGTTFHCSINLLNDSCIRYTPLPGFSGTDSVFVYACNGDGMGSVCDTIAVAVHVGCGSPVAENDQAIVNAGQSTTITILANDYDTCGDNPLSPAIVNSPDHGTVSLNTNGTLTYTPSNGFTGTDFIEYQACVACPSGPVCEPAIVTITVLPELPEALQAQPDVAQTPFETPIGINVLSNDSGNGLQITNVTLPTHGTTTLNILTGLITYTPNDGYSGSDYFFYTVCDNDNNCQNTIVGITVLPDGTPNQAPIANDDMPFTPEAVPVTIPVLSNDEDPENQPLTVSIVASPAHGNVSVTPSGSIIYTPMNGFVGIDSFYYVICDNGTPALCDTALVDVAVGVETDNHAPVAQNDTYQLVQNQSATIDVLDNDADPENNLIHIQTYTQPLNGTVVLTLDGLLVYTPDVDYNGMDYFTYVVCDNGMPTLCDTAFVTLFVGDTDLPPLANDDTVLTYLNNSITTPIVANDSDPDNTADELTVTILDNPNNGTFTELNNIWSYTPNTNFVGTDTIVYMLCDLDGKCDTASVFITVAPTIIAQTDIVYTTSNEIVTFNVMENDLGDGIHVTAVTVLPQFGDITASNGETGIFSYVSDPTYTGTDYFSYVICDMYGVCDTTIVAILVQSSDLPNMAPDANNDNAVFALGDTIVFNPALNDTDPNNDPLIVTAIVDQPAQGVATLNPDGTISYMPATEEPICVVLSYVVCDNGTPALCDTAMVTIAIGTDICLNQAPFAEDDYFVTQEDSPIDLDLLSNDMDLDGEIATIMISSLPSHGTLVQNADQFTYYPAEDYTGSDFITYIICDDAAPMPLCDTAYVWITILPQSVQAQPDIAYTNMNTATGVLVVENDLGTGLEISQIVTQPSNGEILVNPAVNVIIYTPNFDFTGVDYFEYQVCDDLGSCDISLVTVYVLPNNQDNLAPTAVNDQAETQMNTPVVVAVIQNDFDSFGGDLLTLSGINSTPQHGTANISANTINYTPNNGFMGVDSLTYVVCDNGNPSLCDTATVVIYVASDLAMNQNPIANDDYEIVGINQNASIPILDNDTDPDGDAISVTWLSEPLNGSAIFDPTDNTLNYTPDEGFMGTDFLSYIICDNGNPSLCDTAYISIVVQDATPDTLYINESTLEDESISLCLENYITLSGFVADTIIVTSLPGNGGLVIDGTCIEYIPDPNVTGIDGLTVMACSGEDCIPVVIVIDVMPITEPPIANDDNTTTSYETPISIEILNNDSDPDGDLLTAIIITQNPASGSVTTDPISLTATYTPNATFVGIDSFAYIVSDETGLWSDTAWVMITIEAPIITPTDSVIAVDDVVSTQQSTSIEIAVDGNDFIPEGSVDIDITNIGSPTHGSLILNPNNSVTYIPNLDFVGIDEFQYQICAEYSDGTVLCDTAVVTITILPTQNADCPDLVTANAFSPNGDGINEAFVIEGIAESCRSNQQLTIFNRWGDQVFVTSDVQNNKYWNGRLYNNGAELPDGTYFYILTYTESNETIEVTGFIDLRR